VLPDAASLDDILGAHPNSNISGDSRKILPGDIYVSWKLIEFCSSAIIAGASVVMVDHNIQIPDDIIDLAREKKCDIYKYNNYKDTLFYLLRKRYSQIPSNIATVTGTNGKTSVVHFAKEIIFRMKYKCISIGTLGIVNENGVLEKKDDTLTTPSVWDLYRTLNDAKKRDVDYCLIEASSHGIVQGRLGNILINAAAFTNIGLDHLDYHKTIDEYFAAKKLLFTQKLDQHGTAILNADVEEFDELNSICQKRGIKIIDYGYKAKQLKIISLQFRDNISYVRISYRDKEHLFQTPIIVDFQIHNIVCAIGICINYGFKVEEILPHLMSIHPPKGRMEEIIFNHNRTGIYVDYAHTPDALLTAINSIKKYYTGKFILVFGCGGDRDKSKRKLMGGIASRNADYIIVTDDNPRSENPNNIRHEIISGFADNNFIDIADRNDAIKHAIVQKKSDDVILIAGKGHEDYQIIGENKTYISDYNTVIAALSD